MKILKLSTGITEENTYILTADGENAIIIDPGDDEELILSQLKENNLKCRAVLLTHAHFDHCNSAQALKGYGASIYMHKKEEQLVYSVYNLAHKFGRPFNSFTPDFFVKNGQSLEICNINITVLHTPGHTAGSCCYIINNVIFSGDTLFNLSIGRTDFPTGNANHMKKSLKTLFALDEDYTVFPGHGISTKLYYERKNNPYVRI